MIPQIMHYAPSRLLHTLSIQQHDDDTVTLTLELNDQQRFGYKRSLKVAWQVLEDLFAASSLTIQPNGHHDLNYCLQIDNTEGEK